MRSRRLKVLVVDDDLRVQTSIGKLLAAWGYTVEVAGDGLAALEKVGSFDPHVIIADLRMPGMGGLALLQELSGEVTRIHFIMISGQSSPQDFLEAMRRGALACLEKPFSPQQLRQELYNCFADYKTK